jgi:GNAT superfamily N-acetyltransferase
MIRYQLEPDLSAADFAGLLQASGLAPRRPSDLAVLERMLRGAQLIITARDGDALVGVARSITDWAYALYCSDLCVHQDWQGRGIGRELLAQTAKAAPDVQTCLLLSAPAAVSFYQRAGYAQHDAAFIFAEH